MVDCFTGSEGEEQQDRQITHGSQSFESSYPEGPSAGAKAHNPEM